jgi:glycosyltransferase involved in cell wall biosynthesis
MKVLVFAHRLELGGTQTNAVELAATLRDLHGLDVVLFATPGPALKLVEEKGLRFLPAPDAFRHPSIARMRSLRDAVRRERPDLLHVWDWWQCLEAYYGVHLSMGVPVLVTDMMMELTRVLPKSLPTTFGTPEIVARARAAGRRRTELLVPAVDVRLNSPEAVDSGPFRERYGIRPDEITLVTVSRLSHWLKSESLIRTVEAVRTLGRELPLRFLIVGDGMVRPRLEDLAREVNASLGRPAVTLTGGLVDPRPAYASARIVVGMGSSALRAMAFAKPVVVVGAQGFSAPLTPDTADTFYHTGLYGRGSGDPGNAGLIAAIRDLAGRPGELAARGRFSRQFVERHFSLETVGARLATYCADAVADTPRRSVAIADGLRTAAVYVRERRFWVPSRDPEPARN